MQEMMPQLSLLGRVLEKYTRIEKKTHDFGVGNALHPSEIHMISTVVRAGAVSVSDLAAAFGNTKGAASQMVAKLVRRGFLEKTPDPEKKSRVRVTATDRGRQAHERHMDFHARHDKPFFDYLAGLDEERYRMFDDLCRRMDLWMGSYLDADER